MDRGWARAMMATRMLRIDASKADEGPAMAEDPDDIVDLTGQNVEPMLEFPLCCAQAAGAAPTEGDRHRVAGTPARVNGWAARLTTGGAERAQMVLDHYDRDP